MSGLFMFGAIVVAFAVLGVILSFGLLIDRQAAIIADLTAKLAAAERLRAHTWQQERAAKVHEWILRVAAPHVSRNELDEYKAILGEHWPEGESP